MTVTLHFFHAIRRTWRAATGVVLLSLFVAGCPAPGAMRDDSSAGAAKRLERQGRYEQAAKSYERLAVSAPTGERDGLFLDASRAWLEAGQIARALATLDRVTGPLPADDSAIGMLLAYRSLRDGSSIMALGQLDKLKDTIPERYNTLWYELRGRAYFMAGDASRGVSALTERELWLQDSDGIKTNREMLWRALKKLSRRGNPLLPDVEADGVTRGWLALGTAVERSRIDPYTASSAIGAWQEQYATHPAQFIALRLLAPLPETLEYPTQVAVLLPMTGRFAATAAAVRDGLMAAYLNDGENLSRPQLRFYDTGVSAEAALQNAVNDGSDFVVGPLRKKAVEEVAAAPVTPPVLALNFLPHNVPPRSNFFQFSLAPEHEAAQVARRALEEGLGNAVALVPNSDWGSRLLDAFQTALEDNGGRLLEYGVYETADNDFNIPITQLLNLNDSRERYSQVTIVTGLDLVFQPRRRQDVQFVFVAANARQGRLIRPAFLYHFAEDLPVFATAAIYEDDAATNGRDLDGLIFADMPWVLSPGEQADAAKKTLTRFWPNRVNRRGNLYAMGFDAYRLIPQLLVEGNPLEAPWPGATGVLSMGAGGRIDRALKVAEIRNGVALILPQVDEEIPLEVDDLTVAPTGSNTQP